MDVLVGIYEGTKTIMVEIQDPRDPLLTLGVLVDHTDIALVKETVEQKVPKGTRFRIRKMAIVTLAILEKYDFMKLAGYEEVQPKPVSRSRKRGRVRSR